MENLKANYSKVFDNRLGFGSRCAVVVIDFIKAYTTRGAPFYGDGVVDAVQASTSLLAAARAAGVPVIYTKVLYDPSGTDGGLFVKKVPALRMLVEGEPLADIDPKLEPAPGDLIMVKKYPSGFFGTPLASTLWSQGIDTIILIGCSTSGCVRATAVDGIQYGFRMIVPRECVGDRHHVPHEASLFDIHAKYGDVLPQADVEAHLARANAFSQAVL